MRLIDVLNKQCNGEIRKGTKLIIDLSNEQDSPETYTYDGKHFMDKKMTMNGMKILLQI